MSNTKDDNEESRLNALYSLEILDTPKEQSYDRITALCKMAFEVPISMISLVAKDRQWFKSRQGLDIEGTPREIAFCHYAIQQDAPLVIQDAQLDARVANNPLVTGEPHIRFYAGVPLTLSSGQRVGTLCVIDDKPRTLTPVQMNTLSRLAQLVVQKLELRAAVTNTFWEVEQTFSLPPGSVSG